MKKIGLKDIYEFIEQSVDKFRKEGDLAFKLKDMISKSDDENLIKYGNWEIESLQFILSEGETKPRISNTNEHGVTIYEYPSHSNFTEESYTYFIQRCEETQNDFLQIRYNQIIWNGKSALKHENQPKEIINRTLSIFQNYNSDYSDGSTELVEILKNSTMLSNSIKKYKYESITKVIKEIISFNSNLNVYSKTNLVGFIERNKKYFGVEVLSFVLDECDNLYNELIEQNDSFWLEDLTNCAFKISSKLNRNPKEWRSRQGKAYENFADYRMDDDSRIVPLSFLSKAIEAYKKAGNKEEVERIGVKYTELSKELKLEEIQLPRDTKSIELLTSLINNHVQSILSNESNLVLRYIGSGRDIFPSKEMVKENMKKSGTSFTDFVSLMKFDVNNNIEQTSQPTEEDKFYERYSINFSIYTFNFLNSLFREGIKSRKITFDTLVKYLSQESWLGQELDYVDKDGVNQKYSWLSLMAPSLLEFFVQYESALLSKSFFPNFIISLDSITLKFEGVMRDFIKRNRISTITNTRNGTREMFVDDFLNNQKVKDLFHKDDIEYFKYVFTSKGINVRNNIAHSFYKFSEYSYMNVILVLVGILRMSNYKLKSSEQCT